MSTKNINSKAEVPNIKCCASCGTKETSEIKLKKCTACYLVQYCGVKCQKQHRKKHKRACKQRAAELRDELLFRQPESSHLGDCPICFLPLPLDVSKSTMKSCCSKMICDGCLLAYKDSVKEKQSCPFCRKPTPKTKKEVRKLLEQRAAANDPIALRQLGDEYHDEGDHNSRLKCLKKAAEMGDVIAHYNLSVLYHEGEGVEKDEERFLYHMEEAAIAGHPEARYNLALGEFENERDDRAVKHLIIAANLGHNESLQELKECYKDGLVSKDDLAAALRAHQAAADSMKSTQRDEAEKLWEEEEKLWGSMMLS